MHSDAQSDAVGTVGSNTQYSTVDAMQYSFFCGTKYLTVVMRLGQIQSAPGRFQTCRPHERLGRRVYMATGERVIDFKNPQSGDVPQPALAPGAKCEMPRNFLGISDRSRSVT
eukprot:3768189-Rhodomonas_salina.2